MMPWFWVSMLSVALPVYVALRRRRNIWIAIAACVGGLVLAAVLEGLLFAAESLMTGNAVTFMDAVSKAVNFPRDFLVSLLFIVAGALNPELLFSLPRVFEDILAGSVGSDLRRLVVSLLVFELITAIIVPFAAAIHGRRTVRWTVIAAGSVVITAARISAGYLHYKEQGIVVVRNDPRWLNVIYDINWSIVALLQTFIQICLAYLVLRALIRLVRRTWHLATGSDGAGHPAVPANFGGGPQ
jgi:hypothetical protein